MDNASDPSKELVLVHQVVREKLKVAQHCRGLPLTKILSLLCSSLVN